MGNYDQYVITPPKKRLTMKSTGSVVFDGLMVNHEQLCGCDYMMGHQFVRKPFKGDNPTHTHDFWEFLCWYGSNPEDPDDFDAEIWFYFGKEQEKYVFTKPTIVALAPNLPHHPLEIVRVGKPFIQIEIMIGNKGKIVTPSFEKDKDFKPGDVMKIETWY